MSEFSPEIAPAVLEACQAGAEEAAAAVGRALDGEFALSVGGAGAYETADVPDGFHGAGLAVLLQIGERGAAVMLPESSGLVPDSISNSDATTAGKLDALAQELGTLLMPAEFAPQEFKAAHVSQLAEALADAKVAEGAALVPLELKQGDQSATMSLIWPLEAPGELLGSEQAAGGTPGIESQAKPVKDMTFSDLPPYSRSLLKVEVPVSVVLAAQKQNLKEVVEIAPGTLLKFDKACDELLSLYVGDRPVAEGEAVKVGDKFGFRILSMVMPEEHFLKVKREQAS